MKDEISYINRQMHAITQMHSLQWARPISSPPRQALNRKIRNVIALDQTDPPKLRKHRQLRHACIRQPKTAGEINVSDPGAVLDESADCPIGNMVAVAEMQIMQRFTELCY